MNLIISIFILQNIFLAFPLTDTATSQSPGVLSGNTIIVPVNAPVNICGNSVNIFSAGNPTTGNSCANA